jgi:hypothetical protein
MIGSAALRVGHTHHERTNTAQDDRIPLLHCIRNHPHCRYPPVPPYERRSAMNSVGVSCRDSRRRILTSPKIIGDTQVGVDTQRLLASIGYASMIEVISSTGTLGET